MSRTIDNVREFHEAFDVAVSDWPTVGNPNPAVRMDLTRFTVEMERLACELLEAAARHPQDQLLMRLHLCQEELSELARSLVDGKIVGVLDALCDMRYVADGTVLSLGLHKVFDEAFAEVHRSNMSKLDEDGRPVLGPGGRVRKGPSYSPPDLGRWVREAGL